MSKSATNGKKISAGFLSNNYTIIRALVFSFLWNAIVADQGEKIHLADALFEVLAFVLTEIFAGMFYSMHMSKVKED